MTLQAQHRELQTLRSRISDQVRNLRRQLRWTQTELAQHLDLSQSRLSEIENGQGSFTAEQFLVLLKLFNIPASHFGGPESDRAGQTQNALVRLGARNLRQSPHVLPGEELDAGGAIREALVDGNPRLVVSAAIVLLRNIERINLKRVQVDLVDGGAPGRLPWLIESTLHATTPYLSQAGVPDGWARRLRRAETTLSPFLDAVRTSPNSPKVWDVLDPAIRSAQTVDQVRLANYAVSNSWHIVTRLQLQDFVDALRSAADDD